MMIDVLAICYIGGFFSGMVIGGGILLYFYKRCSTERI